LKLLKVYESEARRILASVSHERFHKAIANNWKVDAAGEVDGRSVCWLYCWAKNGMSSVDAAEEAEWAFNKILDISYNEFDARVDHEWARDARYSKSSIDAQLEELLGL